MSPLPIKAVLFDLDGTLVDSLPELYEGVRIAVTAMGRKAPSQQAVGAMIGRGIGVLVDRVCVSIQVDPASPTRAELFLRLVEAWEESNGRYIAFYPGVLAGIEALKEKGVKVALVTNKLRSLTLEFLKSRGLEEFFDVVVAGDDCPENKPAPDMLFRAMEMLGTTSEESLMVGDSRNDALAGRAAGVSVALVETGYNEGEGIADWARKAGFNFVYPSAQSVCKKLAATGRL